jgi:hypothetical protein
MKLIKKISELTGKESSMMLPVTDEQLDAYFRDGELLQNAFPHLSANEREFIKSGITPKEWEKHVAIPSS